MSVYYYFLIPLSVCCMSAYYYLLNPLLAMGDDVSDEILSCSSDSPASPDEDKSSDYAPGKE
jgi:hypothetical protein